MEVLEEIAVADLIESWRRDLDVDVAPAFEGIATLRLCRDPATGRIGFEPAVAGSPAFYDALRRHPWYHPDGKAEHRLAARLIGPGDRVLDIGAGPGHFAGLLQDASYTGLEIDASCIEPAAARGRQVLDLDVAGLMETTAEGRGPGFDFVTAFQVLEHVSDPDDFIAGAIRCLQPGGHLILGVPDRSTYLAHLPDFVLNAPPHHLTWWDEGSVAALLRGHGLRHPTFYRFPVEPWERRLWWMAKVARVIGYGRRGHFGSALRPVKIVSWLLSGLLQVLAPPGEAKGATLVAIARL